MTLLVVKSCWIDYDQIWFKLVLSPPSYLEGDSKEVGYPVIVSRIYSCFSIGENSLVSQKGWSHIVAH